MPNQLYDLEGMSYLMFIFSSTGHASDREIIACTLDVCTVLIVLIDQSTARRQVPTHPNDANILQPAFMNTGWEGVNRPMEQVAIKNHNALSSPQDIRIVTAPSALPNLWTPCTQGCVYELSTGEGKAPVIIVDAQADTTSFPRELVDNTTETFSASPHSDPGSPRGSVCSSPQNQRKKEKDMKRKRAQRLYERQKFARICELLDIPLNPKNNLVHRSEYLCIHLFRLVGGIK
jgi:hypothetical protein